MQIIYYVASSIDGYIATPDGGIDWLQPFEASGEDYGYTRFLDSIDGIVMGSGTYLKCLELGPWGWPGKPCRVLSHRTLDPVTSDVVITSQSPREVVEEFRALGMKRVWLLGGGQLATSFIDVGLLTDLIVSMIPVYLGSGIPLFAQGGDESRLTLLKTESWPSGIVQMEYRWGGEGK